MQGTTLPSIFVFLFLGSCIFQGESENGRSKDTGTFDQKFKAVSEPSSCPYQAAADDACLWADAACHIGSAFIFAEAATQSLGSTALACMADVVGWGAVDTFMMDPNEDTLEQMATLAGDAICTLVGCFPPNNPLIVTLKAGCLCRAGVMMYVDCTIARAECDIAQANVPFDPTANPCPYFPRGMACNGSQPRDDLDIMDQCSEIVRRYHLRNETPEGSQKHVNCMKDCLNNTFGDRADCGEEEPTRPTLPKRDAKKVTTPPPAMQKR